MWEMEILIMQCIYPISKYIKLLNYTSIEIKLFLKLMALGGGRVGGGDSRLPVSM